MHARLVRTAVPAAIALLAAAAPLAAQARTMVELTPYAGYMVFGDYMKGPLGTRVSNANGTILGAQLALKLTPNIAVVGHLGRASADLQVGLPILGGIGVGSSQVWLYDAGLQLSAPTMGSAGLGISPFLQLGAGGARHQLTGGPLETNASNFTFNAGLGADLQLSRNVGLRLMAKDYIGRFDVEEASSISRESDLAHNLAFSAGLKLSF